ncbi:hypothetical protein FPZ24_08280 [Sphingomonas panacisoli]|uniref:Uncharacterized protein n=1 Tax=Sphingomonas panacisoli TaxID=1813879 RepID=A0A5B8LK52_9SPHN|nr:hypothetical protein [Sphingomonas panacisoli]QDZ07480.1 hypothetical protein FPZ24_08280 [Sphingomonas panacisoli]
MKIERNIPMPVAVAKPQRPRVPVESMEIGDSVFIPGVKRTSGLGTVKGTALRAGLKFNFKSAVEGDGVRVWRTA